MSAKKLRSVSGVNGLVRKLAAPARISSTAAGDRGVAGQHDDRNAPLHRERHHLAPSARGISRSVMTSSGRSAIELLGGVLAVDGDGDVAALADQAALERASHVGVVFDDQNAVLCHTLERRGHPPNIISGGAEPKQSMLFF